MRSKLGVVSIAVALVLTSVATRQALADLTREQQEALVQEYVSMLYVLDRLEDQINDKKVQISQWEHSINAMESSVLGLTVLLLYAYPPLTDAEKDTVYSQLNVLYIQIPHAQLELDLYESQRDALEAEIRSVRAAMALIASILGRY